MRIYIPTRGRFAQLGYDSTLARIPMFMHKSVVLVVHPEEEQWYIEALGESIFAEAGATVVSLGAYDNIAQKRRYIGEYARDNGEDKFVMLDDDIDFLIRKSPEVWNLRAADDDEVAHLFKKIDELLSDYAQVTVSGREGNNRYGEGTFDQLLVFNTRAMRITGYQTAAFNACEHDRVPVMEDIDVTLQLLRAGHANVLIAYYANGQKMTNAAGGCSIWRTHEIHEAAANRLVELHPGLVRTRQKTNKTDADGFGTRTEVTVQWKRAYGHG